MTIYASYTYPVPGEPNGERHTDNMPASLRQVWEVEGGNWWVRDNHDIWTSPANGDDSVWLGWEELLTDFGPVTDNEDEARHPDLSGAPMNAGAQFRQAAHNTRARGNPNPIKEQIALFLEAEADRLDGIPSHLWCVTCERVVCDGPDHLVARGHLTELRKPTLEIP